MRNCRHLKTKGKAWMCEGEKSTNSVLKCFKHHKSSTKINTNADLDSTCDPAVWSPSIQTSHGRACCWTLLSLMLTAFKRKKNEIMWNFSHLYHVCFWIVLTNRAAAEKGYHSGCCQPGWRIPHRPLPAVNSVWTCAEKDRGKQQLGERRKDTHHSPVILCNSHWELSIRVSDWINTSHQC